MYSADQKTIPGSLKLFGNVRVMIVAALLVAMSSVLGKLLAIDVFGFLRISFENLPVLMAGIWFGPFVGAAVGVSADLLGCLIKGFAVNPIITVGCGCMGLISGLISMYCFKKNKTLNLALAVYIAHIICSMIIKSIGLHVYYGYTVKALLWRIPLYIVIAGVEFYVIWLLSRNKAFSGLIDRMCNKNDQL